MKRTIFLFLALLGTAIVVHAQNTTQLENQIKQLIQQNDAEYQRLIDLRNNAGNEDWLNELQSNVNERQEQITALQKQIEIWINDRALPAFTLTKLNELQGLMKSHNKFLEAIEEHKAAQ